MGEMRKDSIQNRYQRSSLSKRNGRLNFEDATVIHPFEKLKIGDCVSVLRFLKDVGVRVCLDRGKEGKIKKRYPDYWSLTVHDKVTVMRTFEDGEVKIKITQAGGESVPPVIQYVSAENWKDFQPLNREELVYNLTNKQWEDHFEQKKLN